MRRVVAALVILASTAAPAGAQMFDWVNLDHLNGKLRGRVIDYTHNHGADRRIWSPILGRPRDLYVYLPPGYDPSVAYPLILFLHGAVIDEHYFLNPFDLKALEWMMSTGEVPAAIIAAPDGMYDGTNRFNSTHSLWVNGLGGRFEDHVVAEIVPFLTRTYSRSRPERVAARYRSSPRPAVSLRRWRSRSSIAISSASSQPSPGRSTCATTIATAATTRISTPPLTASGRSTTAI